MTNHAIPAAAARPVASSRHVLAAGAVLVLGLLWAWSNYCAFPGLAWNECRLAPSFMFVAGANAYPAPNEGPVTTWIYGPVPLLLHLPATLATGALGALLVAGALNLLYVLVPIWLVIRALGRDESWPTRLTAFGLALAVLPSASLSFIQADNLAVSLGLLSLVILCPAGSDQDDRRLWLAAGAATLALWCKPTELGPVLAQLVWIGRHQGFKGLLAQIGRCLSTGAAAGVVFLWAFGATGLLYNMFVLPSRIPFENVWAKATHPLYFSSVVVCVFVPLLAAGAVGGRLLKPGRPVFLFGVAFLLSLLFNALGFATVGGNINSLHGYLYLLPVVALWLARTPLRTIHPAWHSLVVCVALVGLQTESAGKLSLKPQIELLRQGEAIASQLKGAVYFPWNPLITYFTDHTFYHADDGLATRALVGVPVRGAALAKNLPPRLCVVAYPRFWANGFYRSYCLPPAAKEDLFGRWILFSWPPPTDALSIP